MTLHVHRSGTWMPGQHLTMQTHPNFKIEKQFKIF